jgi:hypothetical protein
LGSFVLLEIQNFSCFDVNICLFRLVAGFLFSFFRNYLDDGSRHIAMLCLQPRLQLRLQLRLQQYLERLFALWSVGFQLCRPRQTGQPLLVLAVPGVQDFNLIGH